VGSQGGETETAGRDAETAEWSSAVSYEVMQICASPASSRQTRGDGAEHNSVNDVGSSFEITGVTRNE
jgi:hypothetical protein